LGRGTAYKMSDVLLLKSKEDIEEKEKTLPFLLYFLLMTKVKATSLVFGKSPAISISKKDVGTRSEP